MQWSRCQHLLCWLLVFDDAHIYVGIWTHVWTWRFVLRWLKTLTKYLPEDCGSNSPSVIVSQAPPAVRVQVVHPIGGLDLSDPGRLGLLSQCSSLARAWDWGNEDQDLPPKERDPEREGNLPALVCDSEINDNFGGYKSNNRNASHLRSFIPRNILPIKATLFL